MENCIHINFFGCGRDVTPQGKRPMLNRNKKATLEAIFMTSETGLFTEEYRR
jgi:hypothetical protein